MKIRNGYVSNSSSSSFIIAFKKENCKKVFNLFAKWKGYETFIKDYEKVKNDKARMEHFFQIDVQKTFWLVVDYIWSETSEFEDWGRIKEKTFCGKYFDLHCDIFDDVRTLIKNYSVCELGHNHFNKIGNEKICEMIEKTYFSVMERVSKEYESFTFLEYSDNNDSLGAYMAHDFMPFMFKNPISKNDENQNLMVISNH